MTDSYGDVHKIPSLTQISMLNKNLRLDFKYDIVFIVLGAEKSSEVNLRTEGQAQCYALLDMALFDFEAEILGYDRG